MIAATRSAVALLELGAVAVCLSLLARAAARLRLSPIPLYLVAGLAVGKGGVAPLDVSESFIRVASDIGLLLLLLTLGLEYSAEQLRAGLRGGATVALVDAAVSFVPGFLVGLALGWGAAAATVVGGVTWISSSGVAAKLIRDRGQGAALETPSILNVLVLEDLAVAVFLPVVAVVVSEGSHATAFATVSVALAALVAALAAVLQWGRHLGRVLWDATDESLLLAVFGLTLVVGGVAEEVGISAAIGAFLVGVALSEVMHERVGQLVAPLRDLFAAVFFLFFSFGVNPHDVLSMLVPIAVLTAVSVPGKLVVGWYATRSLRAPRRARLRAGATLVARGEFALVVAAVGSGLRHEHALAAVAAGFVLVTSAVGPLMLRWLDAPAPAARTFH